MSDLSFSDSLFLALSQSYEKDIFSRKEVTFIESEKSYVVVFILSL
jgi:hypothetical protein